MTQPQIANSLNLLEAKPLLRISVKNLFDTDYYTAIVGDVRVLGNRFVVKYIGNDVLVTVEEGRVMLLDQSSNAVVVSQQQSAIVLTANQQLSLGSALKGLKANTIDADAALAWRRKQLVFRNETLSAVVAELNRYFPEDIRLATTSKTPPHLTAVIKLTDLTSTVASLEAALNLDAYYDAENNVVLQQK